MKTPKKQTAENYIKEIRRNTRRIFSSEQKIQIVMEALRAEMSVAELCRKCSINESQFYKWNKEFLEAGKIVGTKGLKGELMVECWCDKPEIISNQKTIYMNSEHEKYNVIKARTHKKSAIILLENIDSIEEYIENYEQGNVTDNFVFHEKQTQSSKMKEYMMLGLRKIEGISIQEFKNKFVGNPLYIYRKELQKLVEEELIEIELDKIKLTKKGLDFANIVWEEFI